MTPKLALLRYIGKYGLRYGLNAVGFGVLGDIVVEGVDEIWGELRYDRDEQQRREEIQAVAQATADELRREIPAIVQEIAADQPKDIQNTLIVYLNQVPGTIRRSMRRPSDPTGTTVPSHLIPKKAEDLLPFIPTRISPYKPGDYPLPGVDWQLQELLGSGGFGEVWKAWNPTCTSLPPVALKFCLDQSSAGMLQNEMNTLNRVMAQGKHPGIVPLTHTYLRAEHPFLEYEYVGGGDLAGLIKEERNTNGGIDPARAEEMIRIIAEIVGFAHRLKPPIVHRDLKPANILVQKTNPGEIVFKITDFGLGGIAAKQAIYQASRKSSIGQVVNNSILGSYTPLYASPQQIFGGQPDPRDDVYSLGVIWYQLLTGDLTKGSPSGRGWKKRLAERGMSDRRIDLMEQCFEEPEDRIADAAFFVIELDRKTKIAIQKKPEFAPKPIIEESKKEKVETPRIEISSPRRVQEAQKTILIELPKLSKNAKPLKMVLIPAGTFMMGSPSRENDRSSDETQHQVTISKPFYMGMYEVTQSQWETVMGSNPSFFQDKEIERPGIFGFGRSYIMHTKMNHPIETVTWNECQTFIQKLNHLGQGEFRLPTDEEWEYACRAGSQTSFYWGDDTNYSQIKDYAWYSGNSRNKTQEVGTKLPNQFGLFDMSGNVWEWCQDWYGSYSTNAQTDPTGASSGSYRVSRGGSWYYYAQSCRSAFRNYYSPDYRFSYLGLRLLRSYP